MSANEILQIAGHLGAALVAGSLIGLERTFNGRPAGFRTHALVCVASALLMLVTTYQPLWLTTVPIDTVRTDPTRMAQGIMTGIGFLGAGVIFKEGFTVRGLTTAASIWMTAAIGTLIGIGFFVPSVMATAITLLALGLFRKLEGWMPAQFYVRGSVRVEKARMLSEAELRSIFQQQHFSVSTMSYQLVKEGRFFEYQFQIRTINRGHIQGLCTALLEHEQVVEFHLNSVAS